MRIYKKKPAPIPESPVVERLTVAIDCLLCLAIFMLFMAVWMELGSPAVGVTALITMLALYGQSRFYARNKG